jgi:hypothetical protein
VIVAIIVSVCFVGWAYDQYGFLAGTGALIVLGGYWVWRWWTMTH